MSLIEKTSLPPFQKGYVNLELSTNKPLQFVDNHFFTKIEGRSHVQF